MVFGEGVQEARPAGVEDFIGVAVIEGVAREDVDFDIAEGWKVFDVNIAIDRINASRGVVSNKESPGGDGVGEKRNASILSEGSEDLGISGAREFPGGVKGFACGVIVETPSVCIVFFGKRLDRAQNLSLEGGGKNQERGEEFHVDLDGGARIFQKLNEKIDSFSDLGSFQEALAVV